MKFYDAVYAYAIISRNISRKISSRIRKKNVPPWIEDLDKIVKSFNYTMDLYIFLEALDSSFYYFVKNDKFFFLSPFFFSSQKHIVN